MTAVLRVHCRYMGGLSALYPWFVKSASRPWRCVELRWSTRRKEPKSRSARLMATKNTSRPGWCVVLRSRQNPETRSQVLTRRTVSPQLVRAGEPAVSGNISIEDGGELPFDGLGLHRFQRSTSSRNLWWCSRSIRATKRINANRHGGLLVRLRTDPGPSELMF